MYGETQQYTDSMERFLDMAVADWMNPKISPALKKRAGQIILDLNDYLETHYPEKYGERVKPRRLMKFLTKKEKRLIAKIGKIDRETALAKMEELARPRINAGKYETDEDIDEIIPYVANFLKEEKQIGQRTKW